MRIKKASKDDLPKKTVSDKPMERPKGHFSGPESKLTQAEKPQTQPSGNSGQLYHIHAQGQRITDKPMTISDITAKHGHVKSIEANGFRLIPHNPMKKADSLTQSGVQRLHSRLMLQRSRKDPKKT